MTILRNWWKIALCSYLRDQVGPWSNAFQHAHTIGDGGMFATVADMSVLATLTAWVKEHPQTSGILIKSMMSK